MVTRRICPLGTLRWHVFALSISASLVVACGGAEPRPPFMASDLRSCFPSVAQGRWTPSASAPGATAYPGATPSRGLALLDSQVLVYDHREGRVTAYDGRGTPSHSFGRFGRGPGELAPVGATRVLAFPGASWIAAAADTIAIFDGNVVHRYAADGTPLDELTAIQDAVRGVAAYSSSIRMARGGVLIDLEERVRYDRPQAREPRAYRLWDLRRGKAAVVASISLPALPLAGGVAYYGSGEARPRWSLARDCFIISDGSSARLFVGSLGRDGLDTLVIPYTFRARSIAAATADEQRRLLRELRAPVERIPEPSNPSRILGLAADDDGWVWLLPVQDQPLAAGVRVVRFAPSSNRVEIDTVPFFPSAFGAPGIIFGVRRDSTGTDWLVMASLR